jgi:MraZ protein
MSDSVELSFDGEGRIIMPNKLMAHAEITDQAAFVGQGDRFQIWQPAAADAFKRQSRERALRHRGRLKPVGGPVDG